MRMAQRARKRINQGIIFKDRDSFVYYKGNLARLENKVKKTVHEAIDKERQKERRELERERDIQREIYQEE